MFSCLHTPFLSSECPHSPAPNLLSPFTVRQVLVILQDTMHMYLLSGAFPGQRNEWLFLYASRRPLFIISPCILPLSVSVSEPTLTP